MKIVFLQRNLRVLLGAILVFVGSSVLITNVSKYYNFRKTPEKDQNNKKDLLFGRDVQKTSEMPFRNRLKEILNCSDRVLEMERVQYGGYWLVRNFIRGLLSRNMGCAESITYTTNGDYSFFRTLPTLVQRWRAPVSFAVFAPGYDMNATMDSIQHVRNCLPESALIRGYVTFHIYFPAQHMPTFMPHNEMKALDWPYECPSPAEPAPYEAIGREVMYKVRHNLTYPINVGRNIARKAANTYFVFACDIELFPSRALVEKFLAMVARNQSILGDEKNLRVFVLPVFELQSNASLPGSKGELVQMLGSGMAIPFHANICGNCHQVPDQDDWLKAPEVEDLQVFGVGRRKGRHKYWEPFYISDNREPIFDERVTWEGQSNKRIQAYAMCLMDYEYYVLDSAFLVHSPGIKSYDGQSPRLRYVPVTNHLISTEIMPEYRILYGTSDECVV